jgi:hypothetical protein
MANSERSFADRYGRAQTLHSLIAEFTPAFTPPDAKITPAGFGTYVASLSAANITLKEKEVAAVVEMANRRGMAEDLKETALRIKDYVTSNSEWAPWHDSVSRAADKVRGQVLSKRKTPAPEEEVEPETPPKPRRMGSRTQQGFHDIGGHFTGLVLAVKQVTGYTAGVDSGLQLLDLEAQDTAYDNVLEEAAKKEAAYTEGVRVRRTLYDHKENGLNLRMKSIKKAVRSQYGVNSEQFLSVKAVKI